MKKILFTLTLFFAATSLYAQSTVGLVAHWNMNGNVFDVTGNGHDGHTHYVTPVAGMDGVPNTAYYFNGSTSFISAPYMPDLNFTEFSICVTVKVLGFNTGLCEGNYIIARGGEMGVANWSLRFDDNAFNTCGVLDSTKEVFISTAGTNSPSSAADWQYTPPIVRDTWYKVIVTYKNPVWKIYIDCNLINTATGAGYAMGADMDSIVMGMNLWQAAAGYPYPFKGVIDDIRVYNRALPDSEITKYCDTCGFITSPPLNVTTTVGGTAMFSVTSTIATPSYQWQQDSTGTGFTDLSNTGVFSGVNTSMLTITGVTATMNGRHYRCKVYNETSCTDISTPALLAITNGVNNVLNSDMIHLYPNPAGKYVLITLPISGNGKADIIDGVGRIIVSEPITGSTVQVDLSTVPVGAYVVRVYVDGQVVYKKLMKM